MTGNNIIAAARVAYSKIISRLQTEFSGRVIGEEAWHERYSGFRGEMMASLGLGLQQWLAKAPVQGLSYISSQVRDQLCIIIMAKEETKIPLRVDDN